MIATVQAPLKTSRVVFPFTAIVGQEEMKLSLILNVIDPKIGGVISHHKYIFKTDRHCQMVLFQ